MKKKWILGAVITILLIVLIYIVIVWPPFTSENASGTIGKADKPTSDAQEPKINLSSDILKDTTTLKKTIQDLVQFYGFTFSLAEYIDTWLIPQLDKYYNASVAQEDINSIRDFGEFLKNNNNSLRKTLETLGSLYGTQNSQIPPDLENNLLQFIGYVNQLIVKDSVFDKALNNIDKYIKQSEQEKSAKKSQIASLKQIRDKLLVDNFILALALNETEKIKKYSEIKVCSGEFLCDIIRSEIIGYYGPLLENSDKFNVIIRSKPFVENIFLLNWWLGGNYPIFNLEEGLTEVLGFDGGNGGYGCKPVGFAPLYESIYFGGSEKVGAGIQDKLIGLIKSINGSNIKNIGELNIEILEVIRSGYLNREEIIKSSDYFNSFDGGAMEVLKSNGIFLF